MCSRETEHWQESIEKFQIVCKAHFAVVNLDILSGLSDFD